MEIIISVLTLILVVMQTSNKRINLFFQWAFSAIVGGWLYYHLIDSFIIWDKQHFENWQIYFPEFISSKRFATGALFTILVFVTFYRLLDGIFKWIFEDRIENFYKNLFTNFSKEKKERYIRLILWAFNINDKIKGVLPKPQKDDSFDNAMVSLFTYFVMLIHFILCLLILHVKFSGVLLPIALIFLFALPLLRPITNHLIYLFQTGEIKIEQIKLDEPPRTL